MTQSRSRRRAAAAAAAVAVAAAGRPPAPNGEELFTSTGCAGCHTLKAAGATAKVGPDLGKLGERGRRVHPQVDRRPERRRDQGLPADIMPQDFGTKLSKEELDALVKYLLESQE